MRKLIKIRAVKMPKTTFTKEQMDFLLFLLSKYRVLDLSQDMEILWDNDGCPRYAHIKDEKIYKALYKALEQLLQEEEGA